MWLKEIYKWVSACTVANPENDVQYSRISQDFSSVVDDLGNQFLMEAWDGSLSKDMKGLQSPFCKIKIIKGKVWTDSN